jgi:hypothetical protein
MRAGVAATALLAVLALVGCGGADDPGAGAESARHLDPRWDAVLALDLDYDGPNWEQVKLAQLTPLIGVEARGARELLDRAEASASAEGGDITANAEVVWAR